MTPYGALSAAMADSERASAEINRVWRQLAEIEVTEESADGYVTVTVDAGGRPRRLGLDPRIYRNRDGNALATTIVETAAEAARLAHRQAFAMVADLLPVDADPERTDLAFDPLLTELDDRTGTNRRQPPWQ